MSTAKKFMHKKCRSTDSAYSKSDVYRISVPDDKVDWSVDFADYKPPDYTDPNTYGKEWADKDIDKGTFKWNAKDSENDRQSHEVQYEIVDGRPRNPIGRTGLRGRGILGRWGPNHAADPIVSRMRNGTLQFVAIQRGDTGEWAIPGGMVNGDYSRSEKHLQDSGEEVSATLKREFTEETLDGVDNNQLECLWNNGVKVYEGYVDDPRNTDNSWMETVVMNFHDDGKLLQGVDFKAGSDAKNVTFVDVKPGLQLYASHNHFIKEFAERHGVKL